MMAIAEFVIHVFGGAWELFQLPVPGMPFSYADICIGVPLAMIALALVKAFLNRGSGVTSAGRSTQNPKISKERQNDTK